MPNLLAHIHIGLQVVERLSFPFLKRNLGSLLLGCTSPDIRIITKGKRDETHFAPLNIQRVGEGAENLLRRYPRLRDARSLSEPTRAFLAGYISHLVADEVWVLEIYRPYFANPDLFSNHAQANLWDRALQLELDRQAQDELGDVERVRQALVSAEVGIEVEFLDAETLAQWRDWVTGFTQREFSWERLRYMARRISPQPEEATELVEEFIDSMPQSLSRIYTQVPREKVEAFRETCIQEFAHIMKEQLGVESDTWARPG